MQTREREREDKRLEKEECKVRFVGDTGFVVLTNVDGSERMRTRSKEASFGG